jgi:hypothetical protein
MSMGRGFFLRMGSGMLHPQGRKGPSIRFVGQYSSHNLIVKL